MKSFIQTLLVCGIATAAHTVNAESLPSQPTEPAHPGSAYYPYSLFHETVELSGREVEFFAPAEVKQQNKRVPLIVFGHGQALSADNYRLLMEHLARKGVAVVHPKYDTGFFDRNWQRMGQDYVNLAAAVIRRYASYVNSSQVIFSGHSKGGYVALVAAGLKAQQMTVKPAAVLVFEPAGYEAQNLGRIDPLVPVTVTYSDKDSIIDESLVKDIYRLLPSKNKQYIRIVSYSGTTPELAADHFFPLTKSSLFGGPDGSTPLHYYGVWKWLLGAAWEIQKSAGSNYLYGEDAADTGVPRLRHTILRSW